MSESIFKMPTGLGPLGRANLTILQGGFSVGQRVIFSQSGKAGAKKKMKTGSGSGSNSQAKAKSAKANAGGARAKRAAAAAAAAKDKKNTTTREEEQAKTEAHMAGKLSKWVTEKGCWEVSCDNGEVLTLKAKDLALEGQSDVVEELKADQCGKDGEFLGRQAVINPEVGDIVEILYEGAWIDASIILLPKKSRSKKPGSFRVVLLDKCLEAVVPASLVRRKENWAQLKKRRGAVDLATEKLKSGKDLTDDDALEVLRAWAFTQNTVRKNVIPDGESWVYSDTFGLVRNRSGSTPVESRLTTDFPQIFDFLSTWCRHRTKSQARFAKSPFPFTSINVNFGYNAKLHRDSFNDGPSLLTSLGKFSGGGLGYYPDDDKKLKLEQLPPNKMKTVTTKSKFCMIDGKRAHCVQEYQGERFSVVFFTTVGYGKTPEKTRQRLVKLGACWPKPKTLAQAKRYLPVAKGYKGLLKSLKRSRADAAADGSGSSASTGKPAAAAAATAASAKAASEKESAPTEGVSQNAAAVSKKASAEPDSPPLKKRKTTASPPEKESSAQTTPRKLVVPDPAMPATTARAAAALVAKAAAAVRSAAQAKRASLGLPEAAADDLAEATEEGGRSSSRNNSKSKSKSSQTPRVPKDSQDPETKPTPDAPKDPNIQTLRFRVKELPHLALGLQVGKIYTMKQLVKKCKGKQAVVQSLRRKLMNPALFQKLEPG
eukprot:CAMPEP_0206501518 /NCGR_PEP_ID=MMETSP0324_2-20121206/53371_1 /ASSEMBLY_ACC=CAM_ASM_000836 /TAXON_ID=2866 /ORGANISM="Crypthecodinium cohnii, Strain Seligo" /LENGTH=712 /DNA_ID=CAMNT_0053989379 /DNA_START=25 /DNA_END=2159 /DNA_ORIENTATION=+